jgi:hypothetical protein
MSAYPVVAINSRNERVVFPDAAMRRGFRTSGVAGQAAPHAGS